MIDRFLSVDLPEGKSLFLWGARKTGKSTWLKAQFPQSLYIDLLTHNTFSRYSKNPGLLSEEIKANPDCKKFPIIIDEVQKAPELLDEIHSLIETQKPISFILCGSSLRKLKHTGANLLGGRAWRQLFFPLCYPEIPDFDLLRIVQHGLLPEHYLSPHKPMRDIEGYVGDYIIPEVQWEGNIRNLGGFNRFLEAVAFSNGEIINYSNIGRDCGVSTKTVQGYVELLCDMLMGYLIPPFAQIASRQVITKAPKFYFFDTLLPLYLLNRQITSLKGHEAGHAFEHYLCLELIAYKELSKSRLSISYWRTKTGIEVDFVIGKADFAIEVKISSPINKHDLQGLVAFKKEYPHTQPMVVSLEPRKRLMNVDGVDIMIYPVEEFLKEMWAGKIF